jgi:hypothetical protein
VVFFYHYIDKIFSNPLLSIVFGLEDSKQQYQQAKIEALLLLHNSPEKEKNEIKTNFGVDIVVYYPPSQRLYSKEGY